MDIKGLMFANEVEMCPRREYSLSTNLIRKVLALSYHQNRFEDRLNHTNMYLILATHQLRRDPNACGENKQKKKIKNKQKKKL